MRLSPTPLASTCTITTSGRSDLRGFVGKKGLGAVLPVEQREEFSSVPHLRRFFADIELVPGSREALLELSRNHDIFITSAAMEVPSSFADKFSNGWQEHFPFIPPSRIVFCGDKASSMPTF